MGMVRKTLTAADLLPLPWRTIEDGPGSPEFLAIGPGGLFLVAVVQQRRSWTVRVAGDVLYIDGRRRNVSDTRKRAMTISRTLSRRAGVRVPVVPAVALSGSGAMRVYGWPSGLLVTSVRELSNDLNQYGERLRSTTIDKLYTLATGRAPAATVRVRPSTRVPEQDARRLKEIRPNPLLLTAAAMLPAEHRAEYIEWWQSTINDVAVKTPWQRWQLIASLLQGAPRQATFLWLARRRP